MRTQAHDTEKCTAQACSTCMYARVCKSGKAGACTSRLIHTCMVRVITGVRRGEVCIKRFQNAAWAHAPHTDCCGEPCSHMTLTQKGLYSHHCGLYPGSSAASASCASHATSRSIGSRTTYRSSAAATNNARLLHPFRTSSKSVSQEHVEREHGG